MRSSSPESTPKFTLAIGTQTSFAAPNFLEPFHYAVNNKFEAFEWFPDRKPSGAGWDETNLDAALRDELRHIAERAGLRVSLHARWTANPLLAEGRVALEQDLELAKALGASLLNLHLDASSGIAAFVASLLPLLQSATRAGVRVSIENTVETSPQAFNKLFDQLSAAAPEQIGNVGMCLDIGHANLCAATRNNYLGFVDQLAPQIPIIHLHLHENWGDADTHLPLFTGPSSLDPRGIAGLLERLEARNYNGSAILEQWPRPPALLNNARAKLRGMLESRTNPKPEGRSPKEVRNPKATFKPE